MNFPRFHVLPCLASLLALGLAACDSKEKQAAEVAKTLYQFDASKALHKDFSGEKAMEHVKDQVAFGPRPAGSPAIEKTRDYLTEKLKSFGWDVQRQEFSDYTPKGTVQFANLRARVPVKDSDTWKRPTAVLLTSHFDTKLFSSFEFVGANDAGSSTGVLLEMARLLGGRTEVAQFVELVFFDGEEAAVNYTMDEHTRLPNDGLYGSRHYASEMRKWPEIQRPVFMVLLDMVGDKDLKIEIPSNSTPGLRKIAVAAAKELGCGKFVVEGSKEIIDDHFPFLVSGIKAIDLIDLEYPAWHTSLDKLEELSPKSLEIAGKTTLLMLEKYLLGGALPGQ